MTVAQCVMVINIFKSNHVPERMEIGQEFLNPRLNPGITNDGMFINLWLHSLWKCGERLKYTHSPKGWQKKTKRKIEKGEWSFMGPVGRKCFSFL